MRYRKRWIYYTWDRCPWKNVIMTQDWLNYDLFADTFSASRQDMKWPEIDYILGNLDFSKRVRILDVGCGNGRLLTALEGKDIEYIGLDNSEKMLEEAKRLHPKHTFFLIDMMKLSTFLLRDFDYIFFVASFHHLPDFKTREKTLEAARDLLKPQGKLLMTNWNLLSWTNKEKYSSSKRVWSENIYLSADFDIKIGEHVRYYHGFHLDELQEIVSLYFHIEENAISETENNIITQATKK